jgi:DNA-binding transcriptional LysR family regulator
VRFAERLAALVLAAAFLAPSVALGQETTPEPPAEDVCRAGELCGSGDRDDRFQNEGRVEAPDPPGNYARSVTTLALIAAVVGTYLFIALTGRRLPGRRRKPV